MSRVRQLMSSVGWKSALGELILIIIGILAALAVNAWWDGRKDAATARTYLQQLRVDVEGNEQLIDEVIAAHKAGLDAATRLASAFDAHGPLPSCDTLSDLLTMTLQWKSLRVNAGTYSALLATGDIRLIENADLRAQIIRYAGVVETTTTFLTQSELNGWTSSQPFRRRVTFFWRLFEPRKPSDPPEWAGCDLESLRQDAEVREALFSTQLFHDNRRGILTELADANRHLRSSIRAELGMTPNPDAAENK